MIVSLGNHTCTHADYHADKRKVSEAASIFSDAARDRKKTREDSQPVDEDEPGTSFQLFLLLFLEP